MKRLAAILCLLLPSVAMADDIEIHFRDTSGYVTDDVASVNDTYCLEEDSSVSRGSPAFTFGWTTIGGDAGRDRNTGVDKALAGVISCSNTTGPCEFFITLLSTGNKTVCIAAGDYSSDAWQRNHVEIYDDSTLEFTADLNGSGGSGGTPAGSFMDTSSTNRTAAAWRAGQTCQSVNFASTNFVMKIGGLALDPDGGNTPIASVSVTDEAASDNLPILQAIGEE